jgi:hypothetical protein
MSNDDKFYMRAGFRVRHAYSKRRRSKGNPACVRCGVKRRYKSSGWEYFVNDRWTSNNPPCVKREPDQEVVSGDPVFVLDARERSPIRAGILLRLTPDDARDEDKHALGTLWVWSKHDVHYLMQASHVKHVHRVHAQFWSITLANCLRAFIEDSKGKPLAVYVMLREAGIVPLPAWGKKKS